MNRFQAKSKFTKYRFDFLKIIREDNFAEIKNPDSFIANANNFVDLQIICTELNKYIAAYEVFILNALEKIEDFAPFKAEIESELKEQGNKVLIEELISETTLKIEQFRVAEQNESNLKIMASIISLQHLKGDNQFNKVFRAKKLNNSIEETYESEYEKIKSFKETHMNFQKCFNNLYQKLEIKYSIQLFDFDYNKIIEYIETIQNIKIKLAYLNKIQFIFKNHIDEFALCLIQHKKEMYEIETGSFISYEELCKEQIEPNRVFDIRESPLYKESFHSSISEKINIYSELLASGVEEVELPKKRNSNIRFKWNGDEIGLIEIIHLLLATETLTYEYTKTNGLDKGLQAAYKDIFEYFNVLPPDDPSKKVSDIKKRETKILSKKIGGQTTNYHHIFHFVHKLFVNYLKRN